MNFLDLPCELIIIIFDYLDIKTKLDIYTAFESWRQYFAACHFRNVVLSRNTVASVKTLDHELMSAFKRYIQSLNLSGMPNLDIPNAVSFFSNLECLTTLDITFTNIYLVDFVKICPENLQDIAVNFFQKPVKAKRDAVWDECKNVFKEKAFIRIHFVVFDFLDAEMPLMFLEGVPKCKDLKITVADNYRDFWEADSSGHSNETADIIEANFDKLYYLFRDCRVTHKTSICLKGVANQNFKKIEFIFIMFLERIVIYVSKIFQSLFQPNCKNVKVETVQSLPLDFMLDGNIIFKAWNKETTTFDESFFTSLYSELKNYFPVYLCTYSKKFMSLSTAPTDWYCIDCCNESFEVTCCKSCEKTVRPPRSDNSLDLKAPSNLTLTDFCRKDGAVVRCDTDKVLSVSQYFQVNTFHNIKFLRLSNMCFNKKFFKTLFTKCCFLNTLDIYIERYGQEMYTEDWALHLSKAIGQAKNLKNLKLTSEDIDYEILFESFSRCPSLENFHICEYERTFEDDEFDINTIEVMIEKCVNLYSLFIEADMSPEYLTLLMSALKTTAEKNDRDFLCIEVCDCYRGWDQFLDVFNPSPLHILD